MTRVTETLTRHPWLSTGFVFSLLLFLSEIAEARPGGGHSYSGGSRSSGGGSGGGGGGGELVFLLFRLVLVWPQVGIPVVIVVGYLYFAGKRRNDRLSDWESGENIALPSQPPGLDVLRSVDENFSEVLFGDFAYALYARAHEARVAPKSMASCAPYMSEDVRNKLLAREPSGKPVVGVVVGAMRVVSVNVPSFSRDEEGESSYCYVRVIFEANMTIEALEAPKDSHTHYVIEQWTFARQTTAKSREPAKARSLNCPNCDAPFEESDEGTCSFCGEIVNNGSFEWLVVKIDLHHQELRPPSLTGHAVERGTQLETVFHPDRTRQLAHLQSVDDTASNQAIASRLSEIFTAVNLAWSKLDLSRGRPFVSDGLYNYLAYWISAYKNQGLVNRNDNAAITNWTVVKVVNDAHFSAITCRIWASGQDYTMEQESGKVVGGSRSKTRNYSEYWTLIRGTKVQTSPYDHKQCPNCGAVLKINQSGNCEFCAAHITSGEFGWVLSKIEQDESYRG